MKCPAVSFELSMSLVGLLAACILMLSIMFLFCWIVLVCVALNFVGSWVELDFSVGMEAFGWALVNWCSLESGVFWSSQVLGLSLLLLAFSLILALVSRFLHPYSTDDNTTSLRWKDPSQCRTLRELHRVTWRRGRREIEVTRRRRGGIKRRETDLASNQFPKYSPQPGTPKKIHRVRYWREGEERR